MQKNRFGGDRRCGNMINVIAIPYKNFKDKIRIMKENSNIKFSDIDGVLVSYSYAVDEEKRNDINDNSNKVDIIYFRYIIIFSMY